MSGMKGTEILQRAERRKGSKPEGKLKQSRAEEGIGAEKKKGTEQRQ